jgi:hypothetical protein
MPAYSQRTRTHHSTLFGVLSVLSLVFVAYMKLFVVVTTAVLHLHVPISMEFLLSLTTGDSMLCCASWAAFLY